VRRPTGGSGGCGTVLFPVGSKARANLMAACSLAAGRRNARHGFSTRRRHEGAAKAFGRTFEDRGRPRTKARNELGHSPGTSSPSRERVESTQMAGGESQEVLGRHRPRVEPRSPLACRPRGTSLAGGGIEAQVLELRGEARRGECASSQLFLAARCPGALRRLRPGPHGRRPGLRTGLKACP